MGEYIANEIQTVEGNDNVLFSNTHIRGGRSIMHRDGSGLTTLRAIPSRCGYTRFIVSFGANIGMPVDTIREPLYLAIAVNGESIPYSEMTIVPPRKGNYLNVSRTVVIEVPSGTCAQISIKNTGDSDVFVKNATLLIDRLS